MFRLGLCIAAILALALADPYEYCGGADSNCFAIPFFESDIPTCLKQRDCKVIGGWKRLNDKKIKFEVVAKYTGIDDGSHWVGIGLSEDGGKSMGNDAVVACHGKHGGDSIPVRNYWNRVDPLYSIPVEDSLGGLNNIVHFVGDGELRCSFERDAVTVITTPVEESEDVTIDLNSKKYFVELATGPMDKDNEFIAPHKDQDVSKEAQKF